MRLTTPLLISLAALAACTAEVGGELGLDEPLTEPEDAPPVDAQDPGDTGSQGAFLDGPPTSTSKRQLQYVVIPHPDDELASWSMIHGSTHNYPVFVLLTRGEQTSHCAEAGGYEPTLDSGEPSGELPPSPMPQGRFSPECAQARVSSWHGFLDAQADLDPTLDRRDAMYHAGTLSADPAGANPSRVDGDEIRAADAFELWVGENSARVVFDLGDGDLEEAEVSWALQVARSLRGEFLPLSEEYGAIGAAYYNANYDGCFVYTHPDHRAIQVALFHTDQGLKAQWGRTCATDPDPKRRDEIDPLLYQQTIGVDSDGYRRGVYQQIYGWLWDESWPYGESDHPENIHTRVQHHWIRTFR